MREGGDAKGFAHAFQEGLNIGNVQGCVIAAFHFPDFRGREAGSGGKFGRGKPRLATGINQGVHKAAFGFDAVDARFDFVGIVAKGFNHFVDFGAGAGGHGEFPWGGLFRILRGAYSVREEMQSESREGREAE